MPAKTCPQFYPCATLSSQKFHYLQIWSVVCSPCHVQKNHLQYVRHVLSTNWRGWRRCDLFAFNVPSFLSSTCSSVVFWTISFPESKKSQDVRVNNFNHRQNKANRTPWIQKSKTFTSARMSNHVKSQIYVSLPPPQEKIAIHPWLRVVFSSRFDVSNSFPWDFVDPLQQKSNRQGFLRLIGQKSETTIWDT